MGCHCSIQSNGWLTFERNAWELSVNLVSTSNWWEIDVYRALYKGSLASFGLKITGSEHIWYDFSPSICIFTNHGSILVDHRRLRGIAVSCALLYRGTMGTTLWGGYDETSWAYYVRRPTQRSLQSGRKRLALQLVLLRQRTQIIAVLRIWHDLFLILRRNIAATSTVNLWTSVTS